MISSMTASRSARAGARSACPATISESARRRAATAALRSAPCPRHTAASASLQQTSTNPAFRYGRVQDAWQMDQQRSRGRMATMTMNGAVGKTALLLLVTAVGAAFTWQQCIATIVSAQQAGSALVAQSATSALTRTMSTSGIAAFVLALATTFKPNWSPFTAPLYAAAKGGLLGAASLMFELQFPGIVMSSVLLTLGTAGGLLGLYKSGAIEVSDRFRKVVMTAVTGIMVAYLGSFLLRLVGVKLAFLGGGPVGIGIGLITCAVASAMLLLDFDMLERMETSSAPRWMEWYGGFSVLVTLLWMYLEILKLAARFAQMQRND